MDETNWDLFHKYRLVERFSTKILVKSFKMNSLIFDGFFPLKSHINLMWCNNRKSPFLVCMFGLYYVIFLDFNITTKLKKKKKNQP